MQLLPLLLAIASAQTVTIGSRVMPTAPDNTPVAPGMRVTIFPSHEDGATRCFDWSRVVVRFAPEGSDPVEDATLLEDSPDCSSRDLIVPPGLPPGPAQVYFWDEDETPYEPRTVQVVRSRFLVDTLSWVKDWLPAKASHAGSGDRSPVGLTTPAVPGGVIAITGTGLGLAEASEIAVNLGDTTITAESVENIAPGVDEVRFVVPESIEFEGCYVPLTVTSADLESNPASLPVMLSGSPCRHPLELSETQLTRLDNGETIPVAELRLEVSGRLPPWFETAVTTLGYLDRTEIAASVGASLTDRQSLGCHVFPVERSQPRGFGLSHPGGAFETDSKLQLTGPQGQVLPFAKTAPGTYNASSLLNFRRLLVSGEWTLATEESETGDSFQARFHMPPQLRIQNPEDARPVPDGESEVQWDGSRYDAGDLVSVTIRSASGKSFLECAAPGDSGRMVIAWRLLGEDLGQPPFVWLTKRRDGRPIPFPVTLQDGSEAVGLVSYTVRDLEP